jgi:CRISPR/Cas system-associated exonuclease Cas4 (RecB family)
VKDPDRRDRPSVSKFSDYEKCAAKYQYELRAPVEEPNEWASYGHEVHLAWSHLKEGKALPEEIMTVLKSADKQLDSALEEVAEVTKTDTIETALIEERLWYPDDLYSGRPDKVFIFKDKFRTAFVPDLKTLWGPVEPPAVNWQGRGTVPLIRHNLHSKRVIFAIIQPARGWLPPAFYDEKRVEQAEVASLQLIAGIDVEEPVPTPGEHCGRCAARLYCKAALALPELTANLTEGSRLAGLMQTLPDRMLERVYRFGKAADKIKEAAKKELKVRVDKEPEKFPDWKLVSTGHVSELGDLQEIFSHVREMVGIPEEGPEFDSFLAAFRSCMTLSLPELGKVVAQLTAMSQDGARKALDKYLMLRGLLTEKPKERALEEKTDPELE